MKKAIAALKLTAAFTLLMTASGCVSVQDCDYSGTYGVDDERGAYVTGTASCPIQSSAGGGTITCSGTYWLDTGQYEGSCQ